jgi:hypothetical protein
MHADVQTLNLCASYTKVQEAAAVITAAVARPYFETLIERFFPLLG